MTQDYTNPYTQKIMWVLSLHMNKHPESLKIVWEHNNFKTLVPCRANTVYFSSRLYLNGLALGDWVLYGHSEAELKFQLHDRGFLSCCNVATYFLKNSLCFEWDPSTINICSVLVYRSFTLTTLYTPASDSFVSKLRIHTWVTS